MGTPNKASLAEALKQTQPFADITQEAYLSILRTASEISHVADRILKEHGITQAQYNVLRILRGAGCKGLCRNEIAGRLVTAMPDVSRLLDRMEDAGLISRERGQKDRRQVSTFITPDGLTLLKELDEPVKNAHRAQFKGMKEGQLRELIDLLTEVRKRTV
ncbi:MAG: MarR family transcriptional regulator [Acidobacteriaceae bacterium]|jgi:DNA-binding MarR family transcriptional regulator|nr:MarR family transcriptional regulator [Acidobacteriaceae bacterium]